MTKLRKNVIRIASMVGVLFFAGGFLVDSYRPIQENIVSKAEANAKATNLNVDTHTEDYFDPNAVYQIPDTISETQDISVIVKMDTETVMDAYNDYAGQETLSEFTQTASAKKVEKKIEKERATLLKQLNNSGVRYTLGEQYDTILSGFEITIKAKDFEKVGKLFSSSATLIIGEEYERAETKVVMNDVDVYETGIFDSSKSKYKGDGVVVAVLDTGLDYTHSAFSPDNFTTTNEAFNLKTVSDKISQTTAATLTKGLTGEDVYVNKKVPFAYDYADKDPDVLPINSDHGTHVAGIIAGKDAEDKADGIVGVAPNAQLAIMKVFSDAQDGAKTSWILAGVEDCVVLGVDVINMSLGSTAGFTREVDEEHINEVYDSVKDAGITLIAAAANNYNATMGSEKNGNNPVTSNPDSGTVGSPSTYSAALSVASVDGVKTPYLKYGEEIIYFNEASTSDADQKKSFVDEILKTVGDPDSYDFEYVTIPGIGRFSDYPQDEEFYKGKIVLVKRGTTTFEDKVRVALREKGAAGIIIYNNVSGSISMSVGADVGAVCSISQDNGELLAAAGTGIIHVDKSNKAGPFMSEFSSWGPTSDLKIKPEITAHGGEIYSAVPGQGYDRLSGTSMASPNQAGAAALIRQYVRNELGNYNEKLTVEEAREVTAIVNQLMMSTADIIKNKNDLPYAVRKQGAGLINITNATTSAAYIVTYDKDGNKMDRTKLELGDDKDRDGVYEMKFDVKNITGNTIAYDVSSVLLTEGVSPTYTSHGDTTSTQEGYLLDSSNTVVTKVEGGTLIGNTVKINGNGTATVSVKITLAEADKQYIEASFAHGMYVEGFVKLRATEGTTVNMNVPMLAFFGDWTKAPIFDEEYYDTHADEINPGIDEEDKLMADAYATRAIGSLYSDYITTLGMYYFKQDPAATQIAASKEHIALSNQEGDEQNVSVNGIRSIWAGLLRNVKELNISIVEDSTGKEIYSKDIFNQRKSTSGGNSVYPSNIDVEFKTQDYQLKNNTQYTVTVTSYIDYGEKDDQKNVRNVFSFPVFIDYQAPAVTDVSYRTEYDQMTKKTKLFADLSVYDNHYAMAIQLGQVLPETDPETSYIFTLDTFGKYMTPIYSEFNSTTTVSIELTDYVAQLKNSVGSSYDENGDLTINYNNNSFLAVCYDYAMNTSTFEIRLPDEILSMYFKEEVINLSPNETKEIKDLLEIFPNESWLQVLNYETDNKDVVDIVNQTILAKASGDAKLTAYGYDRNGKKIQESINIHVLSDTEEGYVGGYTIPEVNKFTITGYTTNKAFYSVSNDEREIGETDKQYSFDGEYTLSMFPSEAVTLEHTLDSYFPDRTTVTYKVGNSKIASVDENGKITALAQGSTTVNVSVMFDGKQTLFSGRVTVKVKDPFTTNAIYLSTYRGLGGEVVIPDDRGLTTIYAYAFSLYEYVDKDLSAGDVIDKEDPYYIKPQHIGNDTITRVVIPEGVTHIQQYAFAGLTALEEVVFPKSLVNIGVGAFYGCNKLKTITELETWKKAQENPEAANTLKKNTGLKYVKFINEKAFSGCALETMDLSSVVAIGNYTFENCPLVEVNLPKTSQSLGIGAFANNKYLSSVTFDAPRIKIGSNAFIGCELLTSIDINAAVIAAYAFKDCKSLQNVTLGNDVAIIGEYAFMGTNVAEFTLKDPKESQFFIGQNGETLVNKGGILYKKEVDTEATNAAGYTVYEKKNIVLGAPMYAGTNNELVLTGVETIGIGAFAGNTRIFEVVANDVTYIGAYAFAACSNMQTIRMDKAVTIDDYAFAGAGLTSLPALENVETIGRYAFSNTKMTELYITAGASIGEYAFAENKYLEKVTVGNDVTLGAYTFFCDVEVHAFDPEKEMTMAEADKLFKAYYTPYTYYVKDDAGNVIETYSYYRYNFATGVISNLKTVQVGDNVTIGESAFAGNAKMTSLTLGDGTVVGDYAFMNVAALTEVDLSKVASIGKYAFSGEVSQVFCLRDNVWSLAYERAYVDGEVVLIGNAFSSFAPQITEVDLTKATEIKEGAFSYNEALTKVTFGEQISELSDYAFAACTALASANLANVTSLGKYAFYNTALTTADISNVQAIPDYAFALTGLTEVTLAEGATIGEGAFAYCEELTKVNNLNTTVEIGTQAFAFTALTSANLENVTKLGDFAFRASSVSEIVLGSKLNEIGENPFAGCAIETYARVKEIEFNGDVVKTEIEGTYDISENVKVINGVLYSKVPNGLMLVSYPIGKADTTYTIEEGTVRIAARAFEDAKLSDVKIASTVKAIGDKAFYGCDELALVVFTSYQAPTLEEAYDIEYMTYDNLPFTGRMGEYEGLGIVDFYMWNVTSNYSNFYFGANFVDYVGRVSAPLVMVCPVNGQNYDSFIFSKYFATRVQGSAAATAATLDVIQRINALPQTAMLTLADADTVASIRAAYDAISSLEQKSLISNYGTLTAAESMIEYLRLNGGQDDPEPTPNDSTSDSQTTTKDSSNGLLIAVIALGVVVFVLGAYIVLDKFLLNKGPVNKEE